MPETDGRCEVSFELNGVPTQVKAWPLERLLDVLRSQCVQTGTKEGCGEGECGACSVYVDDVLVNACLIPIAQLEGARVVTIEGLKKAPEFPVVQDAFIALNGAQCGICTPGMVMATVALLRRQPDPTDAEIREGLAGNLCRCTGYMKIIAAVDAAAETLREGA